MMHGTLNAWMTGCNCESCALAQRIYFDELKARLHGSTDTKQSNPQASTTTGSGLRYQQLAD